MRIKRIFLFILTFFLFITFEPVFAKDYSIPEVDIVATINKDCSVDFTESRTFILNDSFTFGYYDLPKSGFEKVERFNVYELDKNGKKVKLQQEIEEDGENLRVKFFYKAYYEQKTIIYEYKLSKVVKVYKDYGEFYWKLQGSGWDREIGKFRATIKLLTPIPKESYFVWAHGPAWGDIKKIDDKTILLTVNNVPPNNFVEARILLPANYFENAKVSNSLIKSKVLSEEKEWTIKSNIKRIFSKILFYIPFIGFFFFLFLLFYFYKKYGVEYKPVKKYIYYREIPSSIPPAVLGYLINFGAFRIEYLKATLMDLIHRKIISIEVIDERKRRYLLKYLSNSEPLNDYEKILLDEILFDKKNEIEIKELNKKFRGRSEHYYRLFEDFKKKVATKSKEYDFFDKVSENKGDLVVGLAVLIIILSFVFSIFLMNPYFLIWLILAPLYIFGGIKAIPRRSFKGKEEYDKWMAFKRFLNDFSNLKDYGPKSVVIWEKYLVYGTILGVSKKVIKALKIVLPELQDIHTGTFIYFATQSSLATFDRAFDSINNSLTTAAASLSSTYKTSGSSFSSWSGGGGGFSGGGGGGGGGSGGGMG